MIPEMFNSDDILYHYCSTNTALNYILREQKIRISPRKNAIDPIESLDYFFSFSADNMKFDEVRSESVDEIERKARKKISDAKQLCFCMNDISRYRTNINPNYPKEYFGFLKPRMWDQYGDGYKGVCLVFSKSLLLKETVNVISNKMEYITYDSIPLRHHSIDCVSINEIGPEKYWSFYDEMINRTMFYKHLDYRDENEFRVVSFSKEEYDYVNIKNALIGIIISENYIDDIEEKEFTHIASDKAFKVFRIRWGKLGINMKTQEEHETLINSTEDSFSKLLS